MGVGHVLKQFRRMVRASGEVLYAQDRLGMGRHVHAEDAPAGAVRQGSGNGEGERMTRRNDGPAQSLTAGSAVG